jgi:hypothetical protein
VNANRQEFSSAARLVRPDQQQLPRRAPRLLNHANPTWRGEHYCNDPQPVKSLSRTSRRAKPEAGGHCHLRSEDSPKGIRFRASPTYEDLDASRPARAGHRIGSSTRGAHRCDAGFPPAKRQSVQPFRSFLDRAPLRRRGIAESGAATSCRRNCPCRTFRNASPSEGFEELRTGGS